MARMALASARPRQTAADLAALPGDVRAELIDGAIYVTPSPSLDHQHVVLALARRVADLVECGLGGVVVVSPMDVHLPTGDVVQPDLLWVSERRRAILRGHVFGAPDLVVEVVSPSNPERDRIVKRDVYARSGVPEYWLAEPASQSVEVFRLVDGAYRPSGYFDPGTVFASPSFPGLAVPVETLFPPR